MLEPVARSVTVIHRRDQFRAHEDSVVKMRCTTCRIQTFYELKSIEGHGRLERATISTTGRRTSKRSNSTPCWSTSAS
jgi:thioredoxin reductase (NADPH)